MKKWGFKRGKYTPCLYWHERRNLLTLVHGDDFVTVGASWAEAEFKKGVEALQATYEKLQEEKEATLEAIKESGLGLMKAVLKTKGTAAKDEL